ncbi:MAG: hypothetical protein GOV01_03975 [Candidatus Altiarchaeota archaeon]|nr:hypothetical protein [Candidatus Altiarchaeota archaeon]
MRYTRQNGLVNKKKLRDSVAIIAGVGGLGNPAATYLALAGVGHMVLIDNDVIEKTNLNRQFLFTENDIGKNKVEVAKKRLLELNPEIKVTTQDGFEPFPKKTNIVLDCLDNWESREKLWDLALSKGIPVIHGAADEKFGQISILLSEKDTLPLKNKKERGCLILGAAAGVIGSQMALEALKVLNDGPSKKLITLNNQLNEIELGSPDYSHILIRFSEIWIKSPVTRMKMVKILKKNIETMVGEIPQFKNARMTLNFKQEYLSGLSRVFGIKSFSPSIFISLEALDGEFEKFAKTVLKGKSFRVTANRSWKGYPRNSITLERELGAIASEFGVVDLTKYEVELSVEIHQEGAYLFFRKVNGPGGLPYGCEGRATALFSGGIDSPVAAWMAAKRGAELEFLFLNPLGRALEAKVYNVFSRLKEWLPKSTLWTIDISKEIGEIQSAVNEGLRQIVYKRFMYRIAKEFSKEIRAYPLVTGESLGQVSSQTLTSLEVIKDSIDSLVLRPLIGMDKDEIVGMARLIGTFDASSKISEFCSIESHSNATPRLGKVLEEERKLLFNYGEILKRMRKAEPLEEVPIPEDFSGFNIVKMWEKLPELKKGNKYLFVCKGGHRSDEKALDARKKGFSAYSINYREAKKKKLI